MDKTSSRILELIAEGKKDREISDILTQEGYRNSKGKPFTRDSVQMRRLRLNKSDQMQSETTDISDIINTGESPAEISKTSSNPIDAESDDSRPPNSEPSEVSDIGVVSKSESNSPIDEPIPSHWKTEIIQLIHRELDSFIHRQNLSIHSPNSGIPDERKYDLPPTPQDKIPGASGRPVNPGKRVKIAGTVDAELDRLFQEWRDSRGMSLSRALDTALWHFLGKPKLSFQSSGD